MDTWYILQIIFSVLMALITLYLTILYIKCEAFKTYSCYNIILMSIVILLDSILQLIPKGFGKDGEYEYWEWFKDLVTIFFDKMILVVLSMQVIVLYMGIIHSKYYEEHEKSIFVIGTIVCCIISGALAAVYASIRWVKINDVWIYDEDEENDSKDEEVGKRTLTRKVLETIFCAVLFVVNVFCLVVVMVHISKKSKQAKEGKIEDLGYERQLIRFIIIFFINLIAIAVSGICR